MKLAFWIAVVVAMIVLLAGNWKNAPIADAGFATICAVAAAGSILEAQAEHAVVYWICSVLLFARAMWSSQRSA